MAQPGDPIVYTLDGHTPVPERDVRAWAQWFEIHNEERVVAQTQVGGRMVSTVFLGVDYNFLPGGIPIVFETMIFPDIRMEMRYPTWEQAEAGHAEVVKQLEGETGG